MGQYFKAVNYTKREYVCPWCVGQTAKLWEWAANTHGAIFTLLLRQSSGGGGGDYGSPPTQVLSIEDDAKAIAKVVAAGIAREGSPLSLPEDSVVGRWAGDAVSLAGDYDASNIWDDLGEYRNISKQVVEAWNDFIGMKDMRLEYQPCDSCEHKNPSSVTSIQVK